RCVNRSEPRMSVPTWPRVARRQGNATRFVIRRNILLVLREELNCRSVVILVWFQEHSTAISKAARLYGADHSEIMNSRPFIYEKPLCNSKRSGPSCLLSGELSSAPRHGIDDVASSLRTAHEFSHGAPAAVVDGEMEIRLTIGRDNGRRAERSGETSARET